MSLPEPPAPAEVPVWLELNGEPIWTWICTPISLEALACGWLIGEGHITSPDQLVRLQVAADARSIQARTGDAAAVKERARILSSGPGRASFTLDRIPVSPARPAPDLTALVESGTLRRSFMEMFERCPLRAQGGGIHSGALLAAGRLSHVQEDVGRHNVMDKVIGAAALAHTSMDRAIVLMSGRISGEIAVKAWRAGIGTIATRSVPTSLARQIAGRAGIWLVGRSQRGSPVLYRPGEPAEGPRGRDTSSGEERLADRDR